MFRNQVPTGFCMIFVEGAARRESPAGMCLLLVELGA
jgi:hypothetical protein